MMSSYERPCVDGKTWISSKELAAISDELLRVLDGYQSEQMMSFLVHKIVEDVALYTLLLQQNRSCSYNLMPLSKYHLSGKLAVINDTLYAYVKQDQLSFPVTTATAQRTNPNKLFQDEQYHQRSYKATTKNQSYSRRKSGFVNNNRLGY